MFVLIEGLDAAVRQLSRPRVRELQAQRSDEARIGADLIRLTWISGSAVAGEPELDSKFRGLLIRFKAPDLDPAHSGAVSYLPQRPPGRMQHAGG
jgi:hypothetical protein